MAIQGGGSAITKNAILELIYGDIGNNSTTGSGMGLKLDLALNNNEVS